MDQFFFTVFRPKIRKNLPEIDTGFIKSVVSVKKKQTPHNMLCFKQRNTLQPFELVYNGQQKALYTRNNNFSAKPAVNYARFSRSDPEQDIVELSVPTGSICKGALYCKVAYTPMGGKKDPVYFAQVCNSDVLHFDLMPTVAVETKYDDVEGRVKVEEVHFGDGVSLMLIELKSKGYVSALMRKCKIYTPHPDVLQFTWWSDVDECNHSVLLFFDHWTVYQWSGPMDPFTVDFSVARVEPTVNPIFPARVGLGNGKEFWASECIVY